MGDEFCRGYLKNMLSIKTALLMNIDLILAHNFSNTNILRYSWLREIGY